MTLVFGALGVNCDYLELCSERKQSNNQFIKYDNQSKIPSLQLKMNQIGDASGVLPGLFLKLVRKVILGDAIKKLD